MKSYKDYRKGKLEAYEDALYIIRCTMEEYKGRDKLKFVQEQLERKMWWNKEELERLEKQEGATK